MASTSSRPGATFRPAFASWRRSGAPVLGLVLLASFFFQIEARAQAPVACFAEGTDPAYAAPMPPVATLSALDPQAASRSARWVATANNPSTGDDGDPITLTWGFVPDDTPIVGFYAGESDNASNLEAYLDSLYGSRATWVALFQQVFDRWDAVSGVRFVYEASDDEAEIKQSGSLPGVTSARPDIRIGGHAIDGDTGIVAYAYPPNNGDIVLDTDDSFYFDTANGSKALRNALSHEVGHALGLQHVCPTTLEKLMEPIVGGSASFPDGPQADDIIGTTVFYGDALESDDGFASSNDFGLGIGEGVAILDLSIDGSGDEDWNVIPDEPGLRVSVTVDPLDAPYTFSAANSGNVASCADSSGAVVDTAIAQDLAIELVAADGATSIVFRDSTPAGGSETLTNYPVPGGGFVRIVGDGVSDPQLYDLVVQYVPEPGATLGAGAAVLSVALLGGLRRRR